MHPAAIPPTMHAFPEDGEIAQLVEQRIENPRVGGSIPSLATILNRCKQVVYNDSVFAPILLCGRFCGSHGTGRVGTGGIWGRSERNFWGG